jgi:hypothetical protein
VHRDWDAEIDRWTERFRSIPDPPEPFAVAVREGWAPAVRAELAAEAEAYAARHEGLMAQLRAAGWDLVRFDARPADCGHCSRYAGKAFSLGAEPELPEPPPLPICPACRHTLNLLTPFFMQSMGMSLEDLIDEAEPYRDEPDPS